MTRDIILATTVYRRRKASIPGLIQSLLTAIIRQRSLLYGTSSLIGLGCGAALYFLGVDPMNIGIFVFIIVVIPPSILNMYETRRTMKLEAEYPALMRDICLSVKSGMSLKGALSIAAEGRYGALTATIKKIDNMISWGLSFEESLHDFARKHPTQLIRRTVFTLIEASQMGGRLGIILEGVAVDIEQTKTLERKRSSETKPYIIVCYISYFVFLAVILVMSHIFLPMMKEAADAATGGALTGGVGQFAVSEEDLAVYNRLFFHALVIQGFFTGIVTGKMGEGRAIAGLKHSVFFIIVALIAYFLLM